MNDVSERAVTVRVEARRLDIPGGSVAHDGACPFCLSTVVDVDGSRDGCPHCKDLEVSRFGSHFLFERPNV